MIRSHSVWSIVVVIWRFFRIYYGNQILHESHTNIWKVWNSISSRGSLDLLNFGKIEKSANNNNGVIFEAVKSWWKISKGPVGCRSQNLVNHLPLLKLDFGYEVKM